MGLKYRDPETGQFKDINVKASDTLPIGAIVSYASATAPTGWLVCDGQAISRTTYANLFAVISTQYGAGDGSTTFNVPNLKGKVVVGLDESDADFNTLGNSGGEKTHKLSIAEMPSHQHDMDDDVYGGYTNKMGVRGDGGGGEHSTPQYSQTNAHSKYMPMPTGGSQAHNNLQPYQVQNYIIKAFQSAGIMAQVAQIETTNSTNVYSCNYINEKLKTIDSLPLNAIIEYEGTTIPAGWESYTTDDAYTQTTLWHTTSWDNMLTPLTVKNLDMSSYDYIEVTFAGQGITNSTTEILKIDLKEQFKIAMSINNTSYMYGTSICFPDIQLLQGSNDDPGIFRIGALVSTDKKKLWVGDTGYFTGQTNSGNFDQSGTYARVSKIVGIKKINRIRKTSQSTYSPGTGSEPKITVWSSSTPMITADNEEIRCIGSDGTVSSLLLSFLDTLTFTDSTKFSSSLVFKTSSNGCSFAATPPTSVSLKMTGDDVTDGNFSPKPNKVYDIMFYWNGFYLNGIVKGTEITTYKITITNNTSNSKASNFRVYTKEDKSDVAILSPNGDALEYVLTQNYLYIEFVNGLMSGDGGSGYTLENATESSGATYSRYKVIITNSPAQLNFYCWQDGPIK